MDVHAICATVTTSGMLNVGDKIMSIIMKSGVDRYKDIKYSVSFTQIIYPSNPDLVADWLAKCQIRHCD